MVLIGRLTCRAASPAYLEDLTWALYCRRAKYDKVLFIGPSTGSEIRALSDRNFEPIWLDPGSLRDLDTEALLLRQQVRFDGPYALWDYKEEVNFIVLSEDIEDPLTIINYACELLGICGYLLFPTSLRTVAEEVEFKGLLRRDTDNKRVAVYLKHPGLPQEWE